MYILCKLILKRMNSYNYLNRYQFMGKGKFFFKLINNLETIVRMYFRHFMWYDLIFHTEML